MVFGLFAKKDPVCGMKQEKGKGIEEHGKWFCSSNCLKEFKERAEKESAASKKGGCCH
ncbi:MAG: YHS domain-containing protein [Nanoarchaeota archaeon]